MAEQKTYRVYISNTHGDLDAYRDSVIDTVIQMGMLPMAPDEIGLAAQTNGEHLDQQIAQADIFIGIYAHRYGAISPDWDKSIIEMEFDLARKHQPRCLFFVAEPHAPWAAHLIERGEGALRLQVFKERLLKEAYYNTFTSLEDLKIQALSGLHQIVDELHKQEGMFLSKSVFGAPLKQEQFKSDIFMIMPFRERFEAVYRDHIKPMIETMDLRVIRGDDFFSENAIMDEIWAAIYYTKMVIAECTERNPNVYYELGIAHAIGKPSILITQTINDIPFDLRHLRIIVYEPTPDGLTQLIHQLEKACEGIMQEFHSQ